jgi:hypothetical protein
MIAIPGGQPGLQDHFSENADGLLVPGNFIRKYAEILITFFLRKKIKGKIYFPFSSQDVYKFFYAAWLNAS